MKKTLFIMGIACLSATISVMAQEEKTVELKVIETSDVHGCFFPYDFVNKKPLDGTLARVSSYVRKQRAEYGNRLLLIDNGDILQGQPICYWTNFVKTEAENIAASVVNYMGYDAEAIGNHDIETGPEVYSKWISEVKCPMLGANIIMKDTRKPYVKPYTILEREGIKIAIVGMLTPTMSCWLNEEQYRGLDFTEMVSCAKYWVTKIEKDEKPDLILGLFHSGLEGGLKMENGNEEDASKRVAQEVEGFDAVFFGHDHTVRSLRLNNPSGKEVVCLDPSCHALNVAEATIRLKVKNGQVVEKNVQGTIVSMKDEPIDEAMVAYFQPQIDAVKQYVGRRIGTFANSAHTRDSYFGNSAFTDFIHELQLSISGADISFNAPLSFDNSIEKGDVTVADMFKLYRFENKLYVLNMTGREIKGHLEMSYELWANTMQSPDDHLLLLNSTSKGDQQRMGFKNFTFNFDSASGIDYEVDVTKPNGQKVNIIRMSDGRPFDEDKVYKVVMNSYRGNGGGDLLIKGAGIPKDSLNKRIIYQSPLDLRHYLMEEIERQQIVKPTAAHNWRFVPEEWTRPAALRDRKLIFGDR